MNKLLIFIIMILGTVLFIKSDRIYKNKEFSQEKIPIIADQNISASDKKTDRFQLSSFTRSAQPRQDLQKSNSIIETYKEIESELSSTFVKSNLNAVFISDKTGVIN